MRGDDEEVVTSLRHRFCRFAFDLFEHVNKTRDSNKKGLKEGVGVSTGKGGP